MLRLGAPGSTINPLIIAHELIKENASFADLIVDEQDRCLVRIEQLQDAHLRDGVVGNLPAAFAGATFHPPVAPARAVPNLQDGPEERGIARIAVLALARVAEGARVIGVELDSNSSR